MNENIPKPLSEKELLELFEKMMVRTLIPYKTFDVEKKPLLWLMLMEPHMSEAQVPQVISDVVKIVLKA